MKLIALVFVSMIVPAQAQAGIREDLSSKCSDAGLSVQPIVARIGQDVQREYDQEQAAARAKVSGLWASIKSLFVKPTPTPPARRSEVLADYESHRTFISSADETLLGWHKAKCLAEVMRQHMGEGSFDEMAESRRAKVALDELIVFAATRFDQIAAEDKACARARQPDSCLLNLVKNNLGDLALLEQIKLFAKFTMTAASLQPNARIADVQDEYLNHLRERLELYRRMSKELYNRFEAPPSVPASAAREERSI